MKISQHFTSIIVISLLSIAVIATAIIHPNFSFAAKLTPFAPSVIAKDKKFIEQDFTKEACNTIGVALPTKIADVDITGIGKEVSNADFNGDGFPDFAIYNWLAKKLFIYVNNGRGEFTPTLFQDNLDNGNFYLADINRDGLMDILIGLKNGTSTTLNFYFGQRNSLPTKTLASTVVSGTASFDWELKDVVGNGTPEIISSSHVLVFITTEFGGYYQPYALPNISCSSSSQTSSCRSRTLIADLNSDGHPDLVNATAKGLINGQTVDGRLAIDVYLGQANGTYAGAVSYSLGSAQYGSSSDPLSSLQFTEFNGDGKRDLALEVNLSGFGETRLVFLPGNGNGSFGSPTSKSYSPNVISFLRFSDFNGDGKMDFAGNDFELVGTSLVPSLSVFLAGNNFTFTRTPLALASTSNSEWSWGDFNNDGKLDVITKSDQNRTSWFKGNTNGTFSAGIPLPVNLRFLKEDSFDINRDGKLDLIGQIEVITNGVTTYAAGLLIGNGDGTFREVYRGGASSEISGVDFEDFDGDGVTDYGIRRDFSRYDVVLADGNFSTPLNVSFGTGVNINTALQSFMVQDFDQDRRADFAYLKSDPVTRTGEVLLLKSICSTVPSNTPPTIAVSSVLTRQQGSTGIVSTVATVNDAETAVSNLTVTATTIPTGITVTNITNNNGAITAQVTARCDASVGANTVVLTVSDGTATATANLTVNVSANTSPQPPLYFPANVTLGQNDTIRPSSLPRDDGSITDISIGVNFAYRGGISVSPSGDISITNASPVGTHTFQITATDNCGLRGQTTFSLTVGTPANTTTGPNVTVTSNNTTVTFSNVTTAGNTIITPIAPAAVGTLPNSYALVNGSLAFEVTTTAVFSGPITLTFNVPGVTDAAVFSTLRVLHGEGSPQTLVDRTVLAPATPAPSFATKQISARVTSLSPFVIATTQSSGCTAINYTAATNFRVGTSPYSVVTGDFNGDGKPDLATANLDSNSVSVLTGNGEGGFTGPINFGVGRFPNSLTVGDFNSDGKADLAVAKSGSNTISIISGDLTGSTSNFSVTSISLNFRQPQFVASGDFNGDGKADIATANTDSNTVSILLGNGAGGFGVRTDIAIFDTPNSVIIGDFNRDGKTDLFALDGRSGSILRGDGAGGFSVVSKTEGGNAATTKDFNSDGKPDLAITQSNGTVSIYLGNGTGEFSVSGIFTVGDNPFGIIDGDFNGDGKVDIATANASSDNVSVLQGNGTGGFEVAKNFAVGFAPVALTVGDFNSDGKLDLATANAASNNVSILFATCGGAPTNTPPSIAVASALTRQQGNPGITSTIATVNDTQTGAGSLTVAATIVPTGITVNSITNTNGTITANVAASVNAAVGNNTVVLTVTDAGGLTATANLVVTVTAAPPPTTGCAVTQLQQPTNYTTAETPSDVSYGDFNGDGKPDLVTSNYEANAVSVMLNSGNGSFAPAVIYPVGTNPKSVTVGDLNGDGKPDLVVTNLVSGDLSILLGNGTGGFTAAPRVTGMSYPVSVAIGDLNGDGKPDLVVANAGSYQTTAVFGNGDGTFTFGFEFFKHEGGMPAAVVMADFDKDGRLDFAVAYNNTNRAIVYFNRPGSYLDDARILDAGDQPLDMVGGDFNGDGYTDLAVANYASHDVTFLTNTRTANFTKTSSAVGSLPRSLAVTNFNGDTLDDLVVANDGTNFVTTLVANQTGAPTRKDILANESPSAVTATDFNGDGKSDVIVADYWVNRITTYQGACASAFAPESEATGLKNLRYVRNKFAGDPFTRNNRTGRGSTQRSR